MTKSSPTDSEAAQLRRRNRELSVLNTIAGALSRSVDLEDALRVTLAQVAELLDLHTGWVWLLHEVNGQPYLAAAQNLPPGLASDPQRMAGTCYCLDTFRDGVMEGAANVNVVTCTRLKNLVDGANGLRYHASIPLYGPEGKRLGVMNVASQDWRGLAESDLRLLHTIGDLLGIAIERARLFARSAQVGAVEERNRIAREIHDTLAQGLTAVTLHLESADALLESQAPPEQARQAVQRALALARANLEEARRSVLDLRAAPLEGKSLPAALRHLAQAARQPGGPSVRVQITGADIPLPQRVEVGLYRIAQEALSNALHHAQATQVRLRLTITPASVRLSVRDDGVGFDPASIPEGHFGLRGIHERAKLLGARVQLESCPGAGTCLIINTSVKGQVGV